MFNVNLKLSSESNAIFLVRPLNLKLFRTLELTLEEGMTCFRWSDESGYYSNHHELLRVNERILRAINFELCHRCDQIRTTGCHGPGVLSADPAANGKSPPSFQWRQWHGGENTIKKTKKKREKRERGSGCLTRPRRSCRHQQRTSPSLKCRAEYRQEMQQFEKSHLWKTGNPQCTSKYPKYGSSCTVCRLKLQQHRFPFKQLLITYQPFIPWNMPC